MINVVGSVDQFDDINLEGMLANDAKGTEIAEKPSIAVAFPEHQKLSLEALSVISTGEVKSDIKAVNISLDSMAPPKPKAVIEVYDNVALVTSKHSTGETNYNMSKVVDLDGMLETIAGNFRERSMAMFIPPSIIYYAVFANTMLVGYYEPEHIQKYKIRDYRQDDIRYVKHGFMEGTGVKAWYTLYPHGLTFICFKKGNGGYVPYRFMQFALKGPLFSTIDKVYKWPGTNVHDTAECCTGTLNVSPINKLSEIGSLHKLFYDGICNNDLNCGKFNRFEDKDFSPYDIADPHTLYAYLETDENRVKVREFPYETLLREGNFDSVQDVIDKATKKCQQN
jgi:hypothetical protein